MIWTDAYGSVGWTDRDKIMGYEYIAKSVGYVVSVDLGYLRLVRTVGHDGVLNGEHGIPVGMIRSIRKLK